MKRPLGKDNTELQHLISDLNANAQIGEMLRALYRKGRASHSDELRDARKVLFYAKAEVERLEKLRKPVIQELYSGGWTQEAISGAAFSREHVELYGTADQVKTAALSAARVDAVFKRAAVKQHGLDMRSEEDVVGQNGNEGEDNWQMNSGVTPPFPLDTRVMVELRNGHCETGVVGYFDWPITSHKYDIIRWRLA